MSKNENFESGIEAERLEKRKEGQKKVIVTLAASVLLILFIVIVNFLDFGSSKVEQVSLSVQSDEIAVVDANIARDAFKEALKLFEEEIEQKLSQANLDAWAKEEKFKIEDNKRQAISEYSSGEYTKALQYLGNASEEASALLEMRDKIFDDELSKSISAYQLDEYEGAKLHISNALEVSPSAQVALDVQSKIYALPAVLKKLAEAKAAKAENDLIKEHEVLSEVVSLVPQRKEIVARVAQLEKLIKERLFADYISNGLKAVENGKLKPAKVSLRQAKSIYPQKQEIALLSEKIILLEKKIRVRQAITTANKAIKNDDWFTAKNSFMSAQKDAPNNQEVVGGLQKSNAILSLKNTIEAYLQKPLRLSNAIVRKSAKQTLSSSEKHLDDSPSLTVQGDKLFSLLKVLNIPVAVLVSSDNLTFVQVRGVGKVGVIQEKIIKLKPGNYTFEGMRKGYKSKLIKVQIPYDRPASTIKVICDEPA